MATPRPITSRTPVDDDDDDDDGDGDDDDDDDDDDEGDDDHDGDDDDEGDDDHDGDDDDDDDALILIVWINYIIIYLLKCNRLMILLLTNYNSIS